MTENYTATLEITPEMEKWARTWADEHIENMRGNHAFCDIAKAILDAKPKPPDLLKQAFAIVCPSSTVDQWPGPLTAIRDMAGWISERHNGRPHGYQLWEGKWYPWFQRTIYSNPFDSQQEAMAWLVVEMHREDTND